MQKEYKTWNLKQIIMYIKIRNGMKEYIKNNEPRAILLIRLSVGLVYGMTLLAIGSIIVKIATIYAK